jgi:p-hydroxybenzoate 3-monooxygenase
MHVPVAIIGAGPSGSLLAWILRLRGIESIVLESRSRKYVESRIRAGVMEQNAVDIMIKAGVGERLKKECMYHPGVSIGYRNQHHFLDFDKLIGRGVTVYGQQDVTSDLLGALAAEDHNVLYEAPVTAIEGLESDRPTVRYTQNGEEKELTADFVAGCDGFHGPSRQAIPADILKTYEKIYPFGWLGVLAEAPPSKDVALFSHHERGFALLSMRSREIARLYLQCAPDESVDEWSDDRIWEELDTRLGAPGWSLVRGNILEKDVTPLRSFFSEPMQHGRLFLAGDASHIVPPTGAKGLNSAFADISVLSAGLIKHFKDGDDTILDQYSEVALRRNRQVQRFSWSNTAMYHIFPDSNSFDRRMQEAQLEHLVSDKTAQIAYAENHTGLPFEYWPEL